MSISSIVGPKLAVRVDLVIEQGTDLDMPITLTDSSDTPVSVIGYTAALRVRPFVSSDNILHEMTTENNKITTSSGKVVLVFRKADFAAAVWRSGIYDLKITSPGDVTERIIEGQFIIDPEVTR